MHILINIPYGHYLSIKDGCLKDCIKATTEAIVNGVILPKGYGRLGDLDALEEDIVNGVQSGNYEKGINNTLILIV